VDQFKDHSVVNGIVRCLGHASSSNVPVWSQLLSDQILNHGLLETINNILTRHEMDSEVTQRELMWLMCNLCIGNCKVSQCFVKSDLWQTLIVLPIKLVGDSEVDSALAPTS